MCLNAILPSVVAPPPTTEAYEEAYEEDDNTLETAAAAAAVTAAAAAAAPPPVMMFPPQGLPQPGAILSGGGSIPAVALTVRKLKFKIHFIRYLLK